MNSKYFSTVSTNISIMMMVMMWMTLSKDKTMMMEWTLIKLMATEFKMTMTMDKKSTMFAACVMLITAAVIMYSEYYMKESKKKSPFMKLIVVFILSMMMLIFSSNMTSLIVGWEGLGMSSFILIMFYQNKKSVNSSFYTMMMNRMGDIMLMMSMVKMMETNSWSFASTMVDSNMSMTMMAIAAFSKSAQMPFSSWLTEAMAAPTPISALVHSSTLVTAGALLLIRLESSMKYSKMMMLVFLISLTTLVMASMNSITEWDVKKIVALSTLSQLSMMFITISMNLFNLAMFHMMVHATFKALIFLCTSSFISFSNTQDMRKMSKLSDNMFITKLSFNTATMTLCGFPFMSSFYSKEMIMEMMIIKKMNYMSTVMFYMCMACTLFYSMKSVMFTNSTAKAMSTQTPAKEYKQQTNSKMMLMIPSVIFGNKMNWMINMNQKIPHMTKMEKLIPIVMSITMMAIIKEMVILSKTEMKNQKKSMMMNYMWFTKNLSIQTKKEMLTSFFMVMKNSEKISFSKTISLIKNASLKVTSKNFIMTHKNFSKMALMMTTALIMSL